MYVVLVDVGYRIRLTQMLTNVITEKYFNTDLTLLLELTTEVYYSLKTSNQK